MAEINLPGIQAEIAALHDAYERALAANDVPALDAFFWDSPHTVRYGINEHLYGATAVATFRRGQPPVFTDRRLLRRAIVSFGPDLASVMSEIAQNIRGVPRHSRQSQVWVRLPDAGWKIVAAHVSHAPLAAGTIAWDDYAARTAAAIGLPLTPAQQASAAEQLKRISGIAAPLLAFPLPDEAEPAAVFTA
jgi:hypothetical protein